MEKICEVEEFCILKYYKEKNTKMYISPSNCTCRQCLINSTIKKCDLSGEAYNTDGDCLMEK